MKLLSRIRQLLRSLGAGLGVVFAPILTPLRWLLRKFAPNALRQQQYRAAKENMLRGLLKPIADSPQAVGPQAILRPVNPWFVLLSLAVALGLNFLPFGRIAWVPDFLAVVLVFWCVRQPRLVGMGTAFVLGMLMDVHDATVLGEHTLTYVLLAYGAHSMHRRLLWFSLLGQAAQLLPLFIGAQLFTAAMRVFFGGVAPGWAWTLLAPCLMAALWPIATALLLAPQRRPQDVDQTRPL